MILDDEPVTPSRYGASTRNRPVAFAMSAAVCLALFVLMVRLGDFVEFGAPGRGSLVAITLSKAKGAGEKTPKAAQVQQDRQEAPQIRTTAVKMPPKVEVPSINPTLPPDFVVMSRKDYASADIGRMARATGGGAGQSGEDRGGGAAAGVGEGPGGATLYAAQWYREPRDAELAPYLPAQRAPGSWAIIACRTIPAWHVEDCREMDESPRGSGLARALRQAAWQFLVRPPRVDGKPQMGVWVRIRFDFTRAKASDAGAG